MPIKLFCEIKQNDSKIDLEKQRAKSRKKKAREGKEEDEEN